MKQDWDKAQYEREKRIFVDNRLRSRSVYLHAALIFTVTWLAGWGFSFLLLKLGMLNLAGRYMLSFALSYFVFLGTVRVWADFMREDRASGSGIGDIGGVDVGSFDGCAVVLIALILGLMVATIFSITVGLPALLEVAFEVVFSGVVVRRMARNETIGRWASKLVSKTWLPAMSALIFLTVSAALLQKYAPGTHTFAQAIRVLFIKP